MPKANTNKIPYFSISQTNAKGVEVRRLENFIESNTPLNKAHRDSHYIFLVQEAGTGKIVVDFNLVNISGNSIFYIRPGQVHYGLSLKSSVAWLIGIEDSLVDNYFKQLLDDYILDHEPCNLTNDESGQLIACLNLLSVVLKTQNSKSPIPINQSLINAFIGLFSDVYLNHYSQNKTHTESRAFTLARLFKSLVRSSFKTVKSPNAFAGMMNVSTSYLNEAVRGTTGLPPSHWIKQEIITEAKKLLFYTDFTIKQIAHELGYEDHAYFSRLFQKITGYTAGSFRKKFRE